MNKSKAKKAVKKSESRKQSKDAMEAQQMALAMQAAAGGGLDPEIQVAQATMQPSDGYVNPYHAMGMVAPNLYSPGNILNGCNYPVMVNPEA